jgi:hypothetical protein
MNDKPFGISLTEAYKSNFDDGRVPSPPVTRAQVEQALEFYLDQQRMGGKVAGNGAIAVYNAACEAGHFGGKDAMIDMTREDGQEIEDAISYPGKKFDELVDFVLHEAVESDIGDWQDLWVPWFNAAGVQVTDEPVTETTRRQKAKKAFLGQLRNVKSFAILSADNPMGDTLSPEENAKREEKLEKLLKTGNVVFYPIRGSYGGVKEHSYFVFNIPLVHVEWLCSEEEMNQESFFYCESKYDEDKRKTGISVGYYKKDAPRKQFHLVETSETWIDAANSDNFSAIGRNFKFSIAMKEFGNLKSALDDKITPENESLFKESLDFTKTGKHLWYRRAKLGF